MRTPSSRRSCTTSSKTRRRRRISSPPSSAPDVAELVDAVTKLDQIKFKSREEAQAESFRKMLLAMVRDLRVILVKLADRTHNMRTIEAMTPPRRRAIARETLEIYAPIAERLGLYRIKLELEDLGFWALYPQRYRVLERALKRARGNQKEFLKKIEQQLTAALLKSEIAAKVEMREKHLYSIYKKMRRKRATLNEIVDVYGLRIVVNSIDTCYRALGVVHSVFKPMPGRFKDYIAIPRVNGYQSLHTTLFGPNGVPIEVQIRTEDMHRVAESGIASHWKYKSGELEDSIQQARAREWLSNLVELQEGGTSSKSSSRASRSTCSPTRFTCSRRAARSCGCRAAPRSSTSHTPCTRTSAIAASPPRWIAASHRCARCCGTARRSRSSPRRARCRTPRG